MGGPIRPAEDAGMGSATRVIRVRVATEPAV
jgi:hypothetical protein